MVRLLILTLLLNVVVSANAKDTMNILVMGQSKSDGLVSSGSPIYQRAMDSLLNQLHDNSFDVYDENMLTASGFFQTNSDYSDGELLSLVRASKRPPIDIVVLFSVSHFEQRSEFLMKLNARIEARILNVKTGKHLGNFEVDSGGGWSTSIECHHQCLLNEIGNKVRTLANDLGAILAEKLQWMITEDIATMASEYNLIFDGYNMDQFSEIEEYLVVFSGYLSHRPVDVRYTRTEIWYKANISTAKLTRNLNKMMSELRMRARIVFSGNSFIIKKITFRGKS